MAGEDQTLTTDSVPVEGAAPAISGTAEQGQALTTSAGSWSGTPAPSYSYQWERCDGAGGECQAIAGATAASYAPA